MMNKDFRTPFVQVGIADLVTVTGTAIIKTSGLGSCVGVILFDKEKEVAGLAHVMLPDSSSARAPSTKKGKYADTAVKELIDSLVSKGARPAKIRAKIAGGAEMFPSVPSSLSMKIGPRNIEAIKRELALFRISIVAEEVGGHNGRSLEFHTKTCELFVNTIHKGVYVL